MTEDIRRSERWEGPTGAAYFVPSDLSDAEKRRIMEEQRRRFDDYMAHAEYSWQPVIDAVGFEGLRLEHTGGGVITLKLDVPEHSAEIWIGPFDADPEPSDEVSFGVYLLDEDGMVVDEWSESPFGGLSNDATTSELVRWLRAGLQQVQAKLHAGR